MSLSHFRALLKKNLLILKRTYILSSIEILSPIIVMILFWRLNSLFKNVYLPIDKDEDYIYTNGTYLKTIDFDDGLNDKDDIPYLGSIFYCSENRIIALIGKDFPEELKEEIKYFEWELFNEPNFRYYNTLEELNDYIKSDKYGTDLLEYPKVCFGISFSKEDNKYSFKLHYFTSTYSMHYPSIPSTSIDNLDQFRTQPDFKSYGNYIDQGFLMIHKLIYDFILQKETSNPKAEIGLRIIPQKYDKYLYNTFNNFLSMLFGFFVLIGYALPLSINIYKLVKEKESRAKEGMKIMGLNELNYFFSYFIIYFVFNLIYSICNAFIIKKSLTYIETCYLFLFFFLYGLVIYSLVYFFQSFLDKSRLAIIISLLLYCLMFILALPIYSNAVSRIIKIIFSFLFPPIAMQLGINTLCNFQINFNLFKGRIYMRYNKISFFDMYILFISNFIFYMFLGFYLQNILSHEYGIKKPWYFLCTKNFWGFQDKNKNNFDEIGEDSLNIGIYDKHNLYYKTKDIHNDKNKNKEENIYKIVNIDKLGNKKLYKKNNDNNSERIFLKRKQNKDKLNESVNSDLEYFESEKRYEEYQNNKDLIQIMNICKTFEDGKVALNNVSFNLYRNEIFSLLGHNGAGKTTLINILTGLYPSSSGSAIFNSYNILTSEGLEKFRKVIGICPQYDILFNNLTVEEHLELFCVFKSVDSSMISNEVAKVIKDFGLEEKRFTKAENLSGGQKRKLSIAIALVGGSSIIFLDEPSSGMDITSRRNLWNILKRYMSGKIIILTTHFMEEASILGNRIGILSEGNMKCIGSPLFLIEKFGKNINLNISKKRGADNNEIINFINENIGTKIHIENEVFNEEILFKIPKRDKNSNINWSLFFEKLDEKCEYLNIKNYSISMPTLEDVFINLSKILKQKNKEEVDYIKKRKNNNDILYDENNYNAKYSCCTKIVNDTKISFKKRFYQIYRDKKTFILEILCPILLTLIGCIVGSIEFLEKNKSIPFTLNQITNDSQTIFYSYMDDTLENTFEDLFIKFTSEDISKIKFTKIDIPKTSDKFYKNCIFYLNKYYEIKNNLEVKNYAYYIISEIDKSNHKYEFNFFVDIISRQSAPIYSNFLLNNFVLYATGNKNLKIEVVNEPLPYTKSEIKDKQKRNEAMILFFISLAFTLIPSNFITIIIKERENNSKHLQIISGISLFSYWFNNFLFELIKYYIIGGICILILYIFKFYQDYLYILYLEYGPAMVSFTYLFSFIFKSEDKGQMVVLLVNLIIGVLGGNAIIIMRLKEDLVKYAKIIIYIFRIIPSFCFCYGYNQLIRRNQIFIVDIFIEKGLYYSIYSQFNPKDILKVKYIVTDFIYLAVESVVYLLILILIENYLIIFKCCFTSNKKDKSEIESSDLYNKRKNDRNLNDNNNLNISNINNITFSKDIDSSTKIETRNEKNSMKKNAIKVQNLIKTYYGGPFGFKIFEGCCKSTNAIRNISFKLDYGEVFGFLGINGAGKTTTFKCLSNEIFPTSGNIYIDDNEITSNFSKIRSLIGYCPQFDAIFEYLTVYENLEFYGLVKGAKKSKIKDIINALIEEINLLPYKDKVSGKLSGGNKRKLSVAIALICNPPIILLDEPSTGMDPESRRKMWEVIHNVSLNRKKSTIIMTTHSMEEAETLCKKIGILINGQFKCLSTIDDIKEEYGYGYEINLQINIPDINIIYDLFYVSKEDKKQNIYLIYLERSFKLYNIERYLGQIKKDLLGGKILEELELRGYIPFEKILLWIYYIKSVMGIMKIIKQSFNEIYCIDYRENNFVFKIKRNNLKGEKSIGFLFGLIESNKIKYNIGQYFLRLSSLEQIFNNFAQENESNKCLENNNIIEIPITQDLINSLE